MSTTPLSPQDYGENNVNLPKPLQTALKSLIDHFSAQEKNARLSEVKEARRQRFYARDVQYIYWNATAYMFASASGGTSVSTDDGSVDMPKYTDVYNIYSPFKRSLTAVLTENPPGVHFEPDDPMNSVDIETAKNAEKYRHVIDRDDDPKSLQTDIAGLFCTDGRVIVYTRNVVDGKKYGFNDDGTQKSAIVREAKGVLETKVQITAQTQTQWPYCIISDDPDISLAKTEYPNAAAEIKQSSSGLGESAYERMARLSVLQGSRRTFSSGDTYTHLVTRRKCWFRPSAFESAPKDQKEALKAAFPKGAYVCFTGDAYCESRNENLDDHLDVRFPSPGDGMNRPSLLRSVVPIQDAFNDYKNLEKEMYDYCIPSGWGDQEAIDFEARREQVSEPGGLQPLKLKAGQKAGDVLFFEPQATVPASMITAYEDLRKLGEFVTAVLPSLFGGSDPNNETKGGISMLRAQAMGQLGLPWAAIQQSFAATYEQGILAAAEARRDDEVVNVAIPDNKGKTSTDAINISELKKGKFHCYPDTDSSFPETTASKRAIYFQLLEQANLNPFLMETLIEPDNLALGKDMIGLPDLVIPGEEARDKQLEEIDQLLKEQPLPPNPQELQQMVMQHQIATTQAGITGGPVPPPPNPEEMLQPSVPVNVKWDYHNFEYEEVKRWLSSSEGRKQKVINPMGFLNVELHGNAHAQAMAAMMPAPLPAPMPKGKPGAAPEENAGPEVPGAGAAAIQ